MGIILTDVERIDARIYYARNKTILKHKDIDTKMKPNNIITLPTITYAYQNLGITYKT